MGTPLWLQFTEDEQGYPAVPGAVLNPIVFFVCFFVFNVEARIRANSQHIQGEQETMGTGEGSTKQCGTEAFRHLWKGEGWGGVLRVNKMDTTGTFRKESRAFEGGRFCVD